MKRVCDDYGKTFYSAGAPTPQLPLKDAAQTFSDLRLKRHVADYDNSYIWAKTDAQDWIVRTSVAFDNWRAVRTQDEAQDFLLSLFLPKLTRQ